jgi:predicted SAM-dependent methyltransferase
MIKLNLGAGDWEIPGYIAIDRKFNSEVYPLVDYEDGSVDEIRASHVLEHFAAKEVFDVVKHWAAKLKKGGILRIAVPDFEWIAKNYIDGQQINFPGYIMGGQTDENDFHKSLFDKLILTNLLKHAGMTDIKEWQTEIQDCASLPVSLNLQGCKSGIPNMPGSPVVESKEYRINSAVADRRYNKYSQFGEDGIIEAIFEQIGAENKWCFEAGASDGIFFSNTRKLIEDGWHGVLVEMDDDVFKRLAENCKGYDCDLYHTRLDQLGENSLDDILDRANAPKNIDLVAIDIDGQDYHVFNSCIRHRPRVVIIEYSMPANKNVDFIPAIGGEGQAGCDAITKLVCGKGYAPLVQTGSNLICVLQGLIPKLRSILETKKDPPIAGAIAHREHNDKPIVTRAVMSMPRLAFTDNLFQAMSVFYPMGIDFAKGHGVFWGQVLSRMMAKHLDDGTDFVLTADYDTWFKKEHVHRLLQVAVENPQYGAFVPVQIKRGEVTPMFSKVDENGQWVDKVLKTEFEKEVTPIVNGHFGLTLFRVSALKKLKKPKALVPCRARR